MTRNLRTLLPALLLTAWCACRASTAAAQKADPDATLAGHTSAVLDVAFSPDGKRLASAGDDGKLKVWDLAGKKELFTYDGVRNNHNRVRFTPDGKTVVALGSENNVVVLDADTGKVRRSIALSNLTGGGSALDLSSDGKTLAVVGRSALRLFTLPGGEPKAAYDVHAGYDVAAVAFSPDGKTLATAGSDHNANLIDAASGKVLRTLKIDLNGVALAFDREGKTLFAASSGQVLESFDLSSGEGRKLVERNVSILTLAVSSDGKSLVLGGPGHGPWVVTLPDGTLQTLGFNSDDWVKSAAVSPDGKTLAGGANGGSVFLWKLGG